VAAPVRSAPLKCKFTAIYSSLRGQVVVRPYTFISSEIALKTIYTSRRLAHPTVSQTPPSTPSLPRRTVPMTARQVYINELVSKGYGNPQWLPEPYDHLPDEYRTRGVQIGDIAAYREDGGTEYFFSIACDADNPINRDRFGVPDGFQVYPPFAPRPDNVAHGVALDGAVSVSASQSTPTGGNHTPLIATSNNKHPKGAVFKSNHVSQKKLAINVGSPPYVHLRYQVKPY
jgi:hypothetical protein